MIAVAQVTPLENGLLHISLPDGSTGTFDIKPYCNSTYFKELLNDDYFHQVSMFFRGIGWPHGQDIGPDTIVEELIDVSPASLSPHV
jgi:Protein of unknown function (DUF2442)